MAYRSNKRARNPLENDEPLNFKKERMGCVYGPASGSNVHGPQTGFPAAHPESFHRAESSVPFSAGVVSSISQLHPSSLYNGGAMVDSSYPQCYDASATSLLPTPTDLLAPIQYNFLPASMQQPVYPKLPGTWMPDGTFLLQKEVITCAGCVLYPPPLPARPPTMMERPPGCRTLFVGGLPENITPEIVRDVFERCGEIEKLRCSNKNFAHIRFVLEVYVEHGLLLSGFRLLLEGASEGTKPSRIHCDYAQARDDSYEYECHQRALQRELRHRQRQLEDFTRSPSPPTVSSYTSHEAQRLLKIIKEEGGFSEAAGILVAWLDRGECNKRTVSSFYAMVQSTNLHVKRLTSELTQIDQQLRAAKELSRIRQQELFLQFGSVERVFNAACRQKVWDHLSKPQRRNIQVWQKQAAEAKMLYMTELCRDSEEMDLSDDDKLSDEPKTKRSKSSPTEDKPEGIDHECAEEHDCVIEDRGEARGESASRQSSANNSRLRQLQKELSLKQQKLDIATATMHNVQQQLLLAKSHERSLEQQLAALRSSKRATVELDSEDNKSEDSIVLVGYNDEFPSDDNPIEAERYDTSPDRGMDPDVSQHPDVDSDTVQRPDNTSVTVNNCDSNPDQILDGDTKGTEDGVGEVQDSTPTPIPAEEDPAAPAGGESERQSVDEGERTRAVSVKAIPQTSSAKRHVSVTKRQTDAIALPDARLIGLVSVFLSVYPAGTTSLSICSYLSQYVGLESIRPSRLNSSLAKYRNMFEARSAANTARSECIWRFVAHRSVRPSNLTTSHAHASNLTEAAH